MTCWIHKADTGELGKDSKDANKTKNNIQLKVISPLESEEMQIEVMLKEAYES